MKPTDQLANRSTDYVASTLKGSLGSVPIVGSALSEIVSVIIPNQRLDRLADFARKLSEKVDAQHKELIQQRLLQPEGTDILEEALWQSARALSETRRDRLASIVKSGLTDDEVDLIETKKLLLLLSQINDLELILLRITADTLGQDKEFQDKFGDSVSPVVAHIGSPPEVLDAHAISESMRDHLVQLGLIRPRYPFVKNGELPEFDRMNGRFKNSGFQITSLGELLLRATDFAPKIDNLESTTATFSAASPSASP